ncbi:ensconsin-like [Procambarus clarkii]|uniref:ensconsin-like n=1 Tax=Procambarus clarkii TaxID=6728 RepID=UPI003743D448
MRNFLRGIPWETELRDKNVQGIMDFVTQKCQETAYRFIPVQKEKTEKQQKNPWFNQECKRVKPRPNQRPWRPQGASRDLQGPPGTSRGLQRPPGASRGPLEGLQRPPGASRDLKGPPGGHQRTPGASKDLQRPPSTPRDIQGSQGASRGLPETSRDHSHIRRKTAVKELVTKDSHQLPRHPVIDTYNTTDRHTIAAMKLKLELAKEQRQLATLEREHQKEQGALERERQTKALQFKEREAAIKERKAVLKEREAVLKEREAALQSERQKEQAALKSEHQKEALQFKEREAKEALQFKEREAALKKEELEFEYCKLYGHTIDKYGKAQYKDYSETPKPKPTPPKSGKPVVNISVPVNDLSLFSKHLYPGTVSVNSTDSEGCFKVKI